jgi:hypothetical protein
MRCSFLLLALLVCSPALAAQLGQGNVACRLGRQDNQAYKKNLWGGYQISLGPLRNAEEYGCTAAIYNSAGKAVFRTDGFSVIFDQSLTGQDFDGDGKPEVVFQTDTGGGAHCCWVYNVVSLFPTPHRLFDLGAGGAVQFEKDKQGEMVIWERTPGPYGFTSMADQPYAWRVFRVREGKLVDSTPEFCSTMFAPGNSDYEEEKRTLTPEKLKQLAGAINKPDTEVAGALLSRALRHVFCRQFDAAISDLDLWPAATRRTMKARFAESIKNTYPEFAARLAQPK